MLLPDPGDAIAAGRADDLKDIAAATVRSLPPVHRSARVRGGERITYLMPRTGVGGGARVLFEHANHLQRHGARVTVISHAPRPEWFALETDFVEVPFGHPLALSIPPCDVIVAGYWDQILPARLLGIAPVVHFEQGDFHLYDEVPEYLQPLVEASIAAADWTITVGDAAASALVERYGVFAHRIDNAIDPDRFFPGRKSEPASVVFVGWDGVEFKGIDVARRVAGALGDTHPDVKIVWITPSPPVGAPFGTTVVAPSQSELAALVRGAAAYVGTSRYESFPLPPLEAMASGTPVISTANEGIATYATHGENALLAPIDDVAALTAATRRVLDDPGLAASLIAGGIATAGRRTWPCVTADLLAKFRLLLETLPRAEVHPIELSIDDLTFEDDDARRVLLDHVAATPYEQFAIPISRPIYKDLRLVRWGVIATKRAGFPGVGRAYLPARRDEEVDDAAYQFGVDLLRAGLADDAFSWFVGQCQQSPESSEASLGRWVLLALIEAGRAGDATDLAELSTAVHSSHPDYYALAARAALAAARPVDLAAAVRAIAVLDAGARFDEWFDHPGELFVSTR